MRGRLITTLISCLLDCCFLCCGEVTQPRRVKQRTLPDLTDMFRKPTVSVANRGQAVGVGGGAGHAGAGEGGRSLSVVEVAGVGLRLLQTGETFH